MSRIFEFSNLHVKAHNNLIVKAPKRLGDIILLGPEARLISICPRGFSYILIIFFSVFSVSFHVAFVSAIISLWPYSLLALNFKA
ncbi:Protein CBG25230 [Caenorhabditis briggsae]|uniref:Protein CBG25230 n=1 Tax=Caenorhabditis briggsae TaxID=6238 RepID=B6IFK0_CAEBR|nr:Protein CBG25230 [Caenorhabditis briggsae]CAR98680.1 Protein CBG25230 [Caenorhabditis briggsae]